VLPRTYDEQVCSIARALEVVGDRWTMLIVRDAFQRIRRFQDFEQSLGLSKKVLADRLERLVDEGVLARRRYQERPERYEYVLTAKGRGLWKVLALLTLWGDEHYLAEGGRPRIIRHRGCGGSMDDRLHCERCGKELEREDLELVFGPALVAAGNAGQRYPWRVGEKTSMTSRGGRTSMPVRPARIT
jgi:DNA-binding HxlR family transcriptional regulator